MTLSFGLTLDDISAPQPQTVAGEMCCGTNGLLHYLETVCGTVYKKADLEYLRVERFRQILEQYAAKEKTAFYAQSLVQDALATAETVLAMRDELIGAGIDFQDLAGGAGRLSSFFEIEKIWQKDDFGKNYLGRNDRMSQILTILPNINIGITSVLLNEPLYLLPLVWQRVFAAFAQKGIVVGQINETHLAAENTQLHHFQKRLLRQAETTTKGGKNDTIADGSIVLIKAKRESSAADFLVELLKNTPEYRPLVLLPAQNRGLEQVMVQEGLPPQGILSASGARPILQILKLATTFLWEPIDPFKILEFMTLPVKPLRDDLALQLANIMAATPGINSDKWYVTVKEYFENLEEKAKSDANIDVTNVKNQYKFWFDRKRYKTDEQVPRSEAMDIFKFLNKWAIKAFEEGNSKQTSLLTLAAQADRIKELLEALPERERRLNFLQLERIVKAVYASSPIAMETTAVGSLPYIYQNQNIIGKIDKFIWWNFVNSGNDHFFNKWYPSELAFLQTKKYTLQTPEQQTELAIWQRIRPILRTSEQLVLVLPHRVDGAEQLEHLLLGELKATFSNWKTMLIDADDAEVESNVLFQKLHWKTKKIQPLDAKLLASAEAVLDLGKPIHILKNPTEDKLYFSPLNNILEYPHQFVFKNQLNLRQSSILSVVNDVTLKGNLAHRLFEGFLAEKDCLSWSQNKLTTWAMQRLFTLFRQEAAVLLMYGREPERLQLQTVLLRSLSVFAETLRKNNWTVVGAEYELQGEIGGFPMAGRADVVLRNDKGEFCIVDLKWAGLTRRLTMLKNGLDLQLIVYSKLLMQMQNRPNDWAATTYYILESAQFAARNTEAIAETQTPHNLPPDWKAAKQAVLDRVLATFAWRKQQFAAGQLEIRTTENIAALADIYTELGVEWMEMLEPKTETNEYDDFGVLVRNYV
jgi:ATP-dependent helicase/nuclease subunit B